MTRSGGVDATRTHPHPQPSLSGIRARHREGIGERERGDAKKLPNLLTSWLAVELDLVRGGLQPCAGGRPAPNPPRRRSSKALVNSARTGRRSRSISSITHGPAPHQYGFSVASRCHLFRLHPLPRRPARPKLQADLAGARSAWGWQPTRCSRCHLPLTPRAGHAVGARRLCLVVHARLVALTGPAAAIQKVALAYRVFFAKSAVARPDGYAIDHTGFIYLVGKDGRYIDFLPPGLAPERIVEALRLHLDRQNGPVAAL